MERASGRLTGRACWLLGSAVITLSTLGLMATGPVTVAAPAHVAAVHRHKRHHRRHHVRHHRRHHHRLQGHVSSARAASASPPAPAASQPAPVVPVPPCTNADVPATQGSVTDMRIAVECLVNQERTSRGLPPLADDSKLTSSAQNWTDQMVGSGDFSHGTDFSARISAVGYDWQEAGENIATGYQTPRDVVQAWMASLEHCQNILEPDYNGMGTGLNTAPVGSWASGPSTWTQDFGLLMSQDPPSTNQGPMNGCPYSS